MVIAIFSNWCWHCAGAIIDGEPRVQMPHRNSEKNIEIHKSCMKSYYVGIVKNLVGIR